MSLSTPALLRVRSGLAPPARSVLKREALAALQLAPPVVRGKRLRDLPIQRWIVVRVLVMVDGVTGIGIASSKVVKDTTMFTAVKNAATAVKNAARMCYFHGICKLFHT